jgi:hypothetical protein
MVTDTASHFGRSPVKIREAIIKVEDLLRKDRTFEKTVTRVGKVCAREGKENTAFLLPDPICFWFREMDSQ